MSYVSTVTDPSKLANASTVMASTGWKWLAVIIGLGAIVLVYGIVWLVTGSKNPLKVVEGADGLSSTSKFQWGAWLIVIIFAYVVIWVLRAQAGDFNAINAIPTNVLTVLGFSTVTAIAAKGITTGYVSTGKVAKPTAASANAVGAKGSQTGGLFQDDSGVPDLGKVQILAFTAIAIGIFLATVINQITSTKISTSLPDVDSSLLVLMGLSQGGYLGKKLVTVGTPLLYPLPVATLAPVAPVKLVGGSFGATKGGSQLLMSGIVIATTAWSDTEVDFTVPANNVDGSAWPIGPAKATTVPLQVVVNGQPSNSIPLQVCVPAPAQAPLPADH